MTAGHPFIYQTPPICAAPPVWKSYNPTIPPMHKQQGYPQSPQPPDNQIPASINEYPKILTQPMEVSDREKRALSPTQGAEGAESNQSSVSSTHTWPSVSGN